MLQNGLYSRVGRHPLPIALIGLMLAGITHLSWLSSEIFRECYSSRVPFEDYLKSTFRNCQVVCAFHDLVILLTPEALSAGSVHRG